MTTRRLRTEFGQTAIYSVVLGVSRTILLVMLARALTPEEYGVYNLIATFIGIGVYALGFELYAYSYREIPGRPLEHGASILLSLLAIELLAAFALLALALPTGLFDRALAGLRVDSYRTVFHLSVVVLVLDLISTEITRVLIARGDIRSANSTEFIKRASWIYPLLLAAMLGLGVSLFIVIGLMGVSAVASAAWGIRSLGWRTVVAARPRRSHMVGALSFGVLMFLAALAEQGRLAVDRFAISAHHGPSTLAPYALLVNLVGFAQMATAGAVATVIYPRAAAAFNSGDNGRMQTLLTQMVKYGGLSMALACLALVLAMPLLVDHIAGAHYRLPVSIAVVVAASVWFSNIGMFANYALLIEGRAGTILAANSLGFLVATVGALVLVPSLGVHGAALALAGGHCAATVWKILAARFPRTLQWRRIFSVSDEVAALRRLFAGDARVP